MSLSHYKSSLRGVHLSTWMRLEAHTLPQNKQVLFIFRPTIDRHRGKWTKLKSTFTLHNKISSEHCRHLGDFCLFLATTMQLIWAFLAIFHILQGGLVDNHRIPWLQNREMWHKVLGDLGPAGLQGFPNSILDIRNTYLPHILSTECGREPNE